MVYFDLGAMTQRPQQLVRELRDFVIVLFIGLAILFAIDRIWFDGRYFEFAKQEYGLDISAARRR